MSELPPPDVMDRAGRFRRLVMAFVVGVVCSASAFAIARAVIPAEELSRPFAFVSRNMNATEFTYWLAGVTFAVASAVTLGILTVLAKRPSRREGGVPPAKQV